MTTTWGSAEGHLQVGIDCYTSTPTAASTAVTVYLRAYVRIPDSWNFDDTQNYSISGTGGGSGSFNNTLDGAGATKLIYSAQFNASIDYDGGPTYSWTASISGMYNGGTPSHSRSLTLPRRPAGTPAAPGTPAAGSVTATGATLSWTAPANNGATLDRNAGQVSRNSGFTDLVTSWDVTGWATSRALTGLPKGVTLYARVRAHNAVGWGGYSGTRTFTTGTTVPGAPAAPLINGFTATTAALSWSAPSDTGGATLDRYGGEVARDAGFTDIIQSWDEAGWTTARSLTDLPKGTALYVRVRVHNTVGRGSWSPARGFTTLVTPPGSPGAPVVSEVRATGATATWAAPSDAGGSPVTGYETQHSTTPSFTAATTTAAPALLTELSGLLPGTTYYLRARAVNSAGAGSWSPTASFTTLSGVKVGDGSTWRDAIVWVGTGTEWVMAQIRTGAGTTWR